MLLILLRIENQLQCIVGLTFITGTKDFMVTTQSTKNDQVTTFICSPNSAHYSFIEAMLRNPPPNHCGEMTENNLYALNQVSQCNIAPENLEVSRAKITMYTKHFRQEINATVCRVKYQSEQWHCGFGDDSSMDAHHTGGITIDLTVTASHCRTLARAGSITLKDETLEFKKGVKQR